MVSDDIDHVVEEICTQGCRVVRDKVSRLSAGENLPETRGLGGYERNMVLLELSEIMEVYGDECAGEVTCKPQPVTHAINRYTLQRS
ncbi:MAG: hypothetical protein U5S82_15975 [Gammaproteobacteria bacterium]|nr:hypothetical protein [Gammaproteobacteria bacterium]